MSGWCRRLAVILVLALAAPASRAADTAGPLATLFGGPFELVDHHGRAVTDRDFRGRHMLVYFGYTGCPDLCPVDLANISLALDELGGLADRVQPLFITVDPARDDPQTLRDYLGALHPSLLGLTGSERQVAEAARHYRVHRSRFRVEGHEADEYFVDHSTLACLMGPDGAFVTLLPHATPPERIAGILRRYLAAD